MRTACLMLCVAAMATQAGAQALPISPRAPAEPAAISQSVPFAPASAPLSPEELGQPAAPAEASEPEATEATQEGALKQEPPKQLNTVLLRGLNKVTARSEPLSVKVGEAIDFGNLSIVPRSCFVSASDKLPEQAAFLEIEERRPSQAPEQLFSGWMFASSPALSALEHPVYDITMMGCEK